MMGPQHALLGAMTWSGVVAYAHPSPAIVVAGYLVCAGAALTPDIDHPGSTVSKSLGPVSWVLCKVVTLITGGHRRGTHSIAGCGMFAMLYWGAIQLLPAWYGSAILTVLMMLLLEPLCRLARIKGIVDEVAAAAISLWIAWWPGLDLHLLPFGVLIGTLSHLLGDGITKQGIPVFWPLSNKNYRIASILAGGPIEMVILRPLMVVAIPVIPLWTPVVTLFV